MLNTSENTSGMYTEQITQLTNAAKAIGYDLKNTDLLWEALQAAGSPVQAIGHGRLVQGNKPLAGVGDALLYLVLRMQSRTLNLHSRTSTPRVQALVNNKNLEEICDRIGLTACINLNPSCRGVITNTLKSTTLEAVIGAVFKD